MHEVMTEFMIIIVPSSTTSYQRNERIYKAGENTFLLGQNNPEYKTASLLEMPGTIVVPSYSFSDYHFELSLPLSCLIDAVALHAVCVLLLSHFPVIPLRGNVYLSSFHCTL